MAKHFSGETIALTGEEAEWLRMTLAEMLAAYNDDSPTRTDWFDADDMAKDVAEFVAGKLGIK